MNRIIISPGKYIQGENAIEKLREFSNKLGNRHLIICDDFVYEMVNTAIQLQYDNDAMFEKFNGECTETEIDRIASIVETNGIDVIIGIGGGKTLDTAKAVGFYKKIDVVAFPTIASTDAPTSSLAVIYYEDGSFNKYLFVNKNPDIVILDTKIIAKAPHRLLASGVGDALSTYFEARACHQSSAITMAAGISTLCSFEIAKLCYSIIERDSLAAVESCKLNIVSQALENIVEANTYLSGIGFESSGLAAAHAIHNGLTIIDDMHAFTHGEKVAFGTLCQLAMENDFENFYKVKEICKNIGLPTCFKDFNIEEIDEELLVKVAQKACEDGETIFNMPFNINYEIVLSAIKLADRMGE